MATLNVTAAVSSGEQKLKLVTGNVRGQTGTQVSLPGQRLSAAANQSTGLHDIKISTDFILSLWVYTKGKVYLAELEDRDDLIGRIAIAYDTADWYRRSLSAQCEEAVQNCVQVPTKQSTFVLKAT
jgi:hypothetical protein